MKKLAGVFVFIAVITMVTGCGKKEDKVVSDGSKSYECILETNEEETYRRIEHIVSVDGKNNVVTYNIIDNGSYTKKETYTSVCSEKEEIEKRVTENKYEHIQIGNSCTEDALTVNSNMFFDYKNLTEEEKKELGDLSKYISKDGLFDQKAWMAEEKKAGYECK